MLKSPLHLSILILLCASALNAQYSTAWTNRYTGAGSRWDNGVDIAYDSHENVYVTGETSTPSGTKDIILIKYNPAGAQEWVRTYNGTANSDDYPIGVKVDFQDNIIVAGSVTQTGSRMDFAVLKYNPEGELLWDKSYNKVPESIDFLSALALDDEGNVYITGSLQVNAAASDMATLKYSSSGKLMWARRYSDTDSTLNEMGGGITIDNGGNVIVTGSGEHLHTGARHDRHNPTHILTVKYNRGGAQEWVRENKEGSSAFRIDTDSDNNIYAGGVCFTDRQEMYLIKYSPSGNEEWAIIPFTAERSSSLASLIVDDSNNILLCGYVDHPAGTLDIALYKYNAGGIPIWNRIFGESAITEQPGSMALDVFGDIYITGYADTPTGWDYLLAKYDTSGSFKWSKMYNGEGNQDDLATSIIITPSRNVIITGLSRGISSGMDCVTISYSQTTGIINVNGSVPEGYKLHQNYPNPFNPVTRITYEIKNAGIVNLNVYDVTGRIAAVLVNERQQAGTYKVGFDASNLSSGVYFYTLNTENFSDTKKMIVLK